MKIQQQDMYHGAALMQVIEDPRFKALNKAVDGKYGHYVLNNDTRLFVKYSTGSGPEYRFSLSPDDIDAMKKDGASGHRVFGVFVCGDATICAVESDDMWNVVEENPTTNQQVWIAAEPGKSMRFGRGRYELTRTIPHNGYPAVVLD